LIVIAALFGMSLMQVAVGTKLLNADDLTSTGVTCKNKAAGTVAVSSISGKGIDVDFTLAAYGAKVSLQFDYDIGDLKDYPTSQLILTLDLLEVNGTDKIKVYLSDAAGDTDYYLGYAAKAAGTFYFTIEYTKIEDKNLSETADVFIVLVTYDKDGAIANGLKNDDHTVGVQVTSGGGYAGQGAYGVIGGTLLSFVLMIRKVLAGIMGAVGTFCASIFTNQAIIIIIVAVVCAFAVLFIREKTIRGSA